MIKIVDMTPVYAKELRNKMLKEKMIDLLQWETEELFTRTVTRNKGLCKVAIHEETKSIVGFILGGETGIRGMLHHLYVDKNFRNQGIGDLLITHAIESFKKMEIPVKRIFGLVYGSNHIVIKILKRNGFILNPVLDQSYPFVIPLYIDL